MTLGRSIASTAAGAALGLGIGFAAGANMVGQDEYWGVLQAEKAAAEAQVDFKALADPESCEGGVLQGEFRRYGNANPHDEANAPDELVRWLDNDCGGPTETHRRMGTEAFKLIPLVYETEERLGRLRRDNGYTNQEMRDAVTRGCLGGFLLTGSLCAALKVFQVRETRRPVRTFEEVRPGPRPPTPPTRPELPVLDVHTVDPRQQRPPYRPPGSH